MVLKGMIQNGATCFIFLLALSQFLPLYVFPSISLPGFQFT